MEAMKAFPPGEADAAFWWTRGYGNVFRAGRAAGIEEAARVVADEGTYGDCMTGCCEMSAAAIRALAEKDGVSSGSGLTEATRPAHAEAQADSTDLADRQDGPDYMKDGAP